MPPAGADPFDGAHLKSFTRDGQATVSGTRFARWRWQAPPGTAITRVRGTWWHALHDGIEQRLGVDQLGRRLRRLRRRRDTDVTPRDFVAGFSPGDRRVRRPPALRQGRKQVVQPRPRLLVGAAGADDHRRGRHRARRPGSAANSPPAAGGAAARASASGGTDVGGGVRFGETLLDGGRVGLTEYPCAKASIGGEWRATRMQPCRPGVSGGTPIATTRFSDGPHTLGHCVDRLRRQRRLHAGAARS